MLTTKKSAIALACMTLALGGCLTSEDDAQNTIAGLSACGDSSESFTDSTGRTVCVSLAAFKAEAPFEAGFKAPGKVTHTVFLRDGDGNPIDVANDDVLSDVGQYPMMYMDSGHQHSTAFAHEADASNGEYGVYNLNAYYPMASVMANGDSMGRWEYRVKVTDNMGTTDTADDMVHSVTFNPTVEPYAMSKAYRAVMKNNDDQFQNSMNELATRRYTAWLDSVSAVAAGHADIKVYLSAEDIDPDALAESVPEGHEGHTHTHVMAGGEDAQTYNPVYAPMTMDGMTMTRSMKTAHVMTMDGMDMVHTGDADVSAVTVEVSTDGGTSFTTLTMAGMEHHDLGFFTGTVPMAAGDVTMLVRVTVDLVSTDEDTGATTTETLIMTKNGVADSTASDADGTGAAALASLKFTAVAAQ